MKRVIDYISVIIALLLIILSCDNSDDEKQKESSIQAVTLSADKGPYLFATLSGQISGLKDIDGNFEYGMAFSTDSTLSVFGFLPPNKKKLDMSCSEDTFSTTVFGIHPGEEYYYRVCCFYKGKAIYSDIKSFTFEWSPPTVTTLDAVLNDAGGVTLKGLINNKGNIVKDLDGYYPYGYYGVECSKSDSFEPNSTFILNPDKTSDNLENDSVICALYQFEYDYDTIYYYRTFFKLDKISNYGDVKSFKFGWNGPEMVDLGLSVKWASCNVGASYPWKYGDYYAWGETETKSYYHWSTYTFCNNSFVSLTKYNYWEAYGTVDNKTTLEQNDDVAYVKWGGSWHMPTRSDMEELCDTNNCSWTWKTQNGINGYLITSKKPDYKGHSIFLPAAGWRYRADLEAVGNNAVYWTSTLDTDEPDIARSLDFISFHYHPYYNQRYFGFTVRPVCP